MEYAGGQMELYIMDSGKRTHKMGMAIRYILTVQKLSDSGKMVKDGKIHKLKNMNN